MKKVFSISNKFRALSALLLSGAAVMAFQASLQAGDTDAGKAIVSPQVRATNELSRTTLTAGTFTLQSTVAVTSPAVLTGGSFSIAPVYSSAPGALSDGAVYWIFR